MAPKGWKNICYLYTNNISPTSEPINMSGVDHWLSDVICLTTYIFQVWNVQGFCFCGCPPAHTGSSITYMLIATEFLVHKHMKSQDIWNKIVPSKASGIDLTYLPNIAFSLNCSNIPYLSDTQGESSLQTIHDVCAIYHCTAIFTFLFQKPREAGQLEEVQALPVIVLEVLSTLPSRSSEHGQLPWDLPWPNCWHSSTHMQILLTKTNIQEGTSKPTSTSTFWTPDFRFLRYLTLDHQGQKPYCNPIILAVSKFNLKMGQESILATRG